MRIAAPLSYGKPFPSCRKLVAWRKALKGRPSAEVTVGLLFADTIKEMVNEIGSTVTIEPVSPGRTVTTKVSKKVRLDHMLRITSWASRPDLQRIPKSLGTLT